IGTGCRVAEARLRVAGLAETARRDSRLAVRAGDLDLEVEEEADRLLADRTHHVLIQREALALVLDQRVALSHRAKSDAVFQVVHLVEVVTPAPIDHREHDSALELA